MSALASSEISMEEMKELFGVNAWEDRQQCLSFHHGGSRRSLPSKTGPGQEKDDKNANDPKTANRHHGRIQFGQKHAVQRAYGRAPAAGERSLRPSCRRSGCPMGRMMPIRWAWTVMPMTLIWPSLTGCQPGNDRTHPHLHEKRHPAVLRPDRHARNFRPKRCLPKSGSG